MLVTGEDRFNFQHHRSPVHLRITNQRRQISLRTWQRVVVADEHNVGIDDLAPNLLRRKCFLIGTVGIPEIAEIFAPAGVVIGANFAFHTHQGMKLGRAAPRS